MWIADLHRMIIALWNSILLNVYKLLGQSPTTWGQGAGSGPWQVAHNIHNGVMGVAVGLALLFWFISFFKYIEDFHKIDVREVAGWVLRFAVIMVIMQFSWMIMESVLDLSIGVNNEIMKAAGLEGQNWSEYTAESAMVSDGFMKESEKLQAAVDEINTEGSILEKMAAFLESLPLSLFMFLIWAAVFICGCTIVVTLYMRFFKMYIYTAIAPLPLSTFAGSTTTEIGKHFLKAWAAVCLELCVMTIAVVIFAASMANNDTIFPFLGSVSETASSAAGGGGVVGGPTTTPDDPSKVGELWSVAVQWSLGVLIKSVLLVSVLKGADHIMEKIIGV